MRSKRQHCYPSGVESAGRRTNTAAAQFKRICRRPRRAAGPNHATSKVQLMAADAGIARDGVKAIAADYPTVGQAQTFQPVREWLAAPRKWRLK